MGNGYNIPIPHSADIPGGIRDGSDVVISGRAPLHSKGFSINLCVGKTYDPDCAFHFNPRFEENIVARNSMRGGSWADEEVEGGMPFKRNVGFEIHMRAMPHGYNVTVNHRHFCDFNHRMPKEMVQHLYIEGTVVINAIQFRCGTNFPRPAIKSCPSGGNPNGFCGPIYNPPVPFTSPIPGGTYAGKSIFVSGIVNPGASRFTVDLMCGPNESCDIALHFDVRIHYNNQDFNQVICTHKHNGSYGPEERLVPLNSLFPFTDNANFELMFLAEPNCFKVTVDNQDFTQFNHRIHPFYTVDHISVTGDCRLTQIRFQ